jgi:GNAT superfamily N-acetyltransferase
MGCRFAARIGLVPPDEASIAATARTLIDAPDGVILLWGDAGMVGGLVTPCYFNASVRLAQELFWWAEDGGGAELLAGLESWARGRGAYSLTMMSMAGLRSAAVGRVYERHGYRPLEHTFVKVL